MSALNWELTPYEQHRKPHETLPGNTEIAVSPFQLHSDLQCPICLEILTNTMTTKECLHRFCSECITTALRNGNKECPTCRKKLVSHRSLRKDTTFDAIVQKIFPDRSVYEEQVEKRLAKLMNMKVSDRYSGSKKANLSSNDTDVEEQNCPTQNIELKLKLHDASAMESTDFDFFTTKLFSTSTDASVDHLIEFLKIRFKSFKHSNMRESLENNDLSDISTVSCNYKFSIFLPSCQTTENPLGGFTTLKDLIIQNPSIVRDNMLELLYLAENENHSESE